MNKSSEINSTLNKFLEIGESEMEIINSAIGLTHQVSPIDGSQLFARMELFIAVSDDLEWIINSIVRKRNEKENDIRKIKDPKYVALVRQGRPSSAAIEAEIRITLKDIREQEELIQLIDSMISYLQFVQRNLDRYLSILKSKSQFIR